MSLVLENEAWQTQQVSGMHAPVEYCQPKSSKESSASLRAPFKAVRNHP